MNIFDGLEKLINEPGTAKIRGERIKLMQDQYGILEKEAEKLRNRVSELQAERDTLHKDMAARDKKIILLTEENTALNLTNDKLLQRLKVGLPTHDQIPDDSQMEILVKLAEAATGEEKLAEAMGRGIEALRYDLNELNTAEFIKRESLGGFGTFCSLSQKGRKFLKDKNLLR